MVKFYAPWCPPCKVLKPEFEAAAKNLKGRVKFGEIDCDQYKDMRVRYNIKTYPTIKVFGTRGDNGLVFDIAPTRTADALTECGMQLSGG